MIKKGDIFYEAWLYLGTDGCSLEIYEWHVTCVDSRGIFLKVKNRTTWGKLSKKNGDYGWLPLSSFWRSHYTKRIDSEAALKDLDLFKSKTQAYRTLLPDLKKTRKIISRYITKIEKELSHGNR